MADLSRLAVSGALPWLQRGKRVYTNPECASCAERPFTPWRSPMPMAGSRGGTGGNPGTPLAAAFSTSRSSLKPTGDRGGRWRLDTPLGSCCCCVYRLLFGRDWIRKDYQMKTKHRMKGNGAETESKQENAEKKVSLASPERHGHRNRMLCKKRKNIGDEKAQRKS